MSFNFSKYQPTGNKIIDHCANLIACARQQGTPLKALHLQRLQYDWFKSGIQTLMKRELEPGEKMQFDGVDIECGSRFQSKPVVPEYYPTKIGQA